jgi:glycosidase
MIGLLMTRRIIFHSVCCLAAAATTVLAQNPSASAQNARAAPEFLNRSTIYQVWMRSFTPEGTLSAVQARLPHIAELGANIVYVSPLNVHGYPSVFGPTTPYEIKDYDRIDPEYGNEDDLKAVVAEAHRLGLKLIMDIVFAHSANDSVLLYKPGFYQHNPDGSLKMSRWHTPMPDFSNAKVQDYFRENMLHWVRDLKVDGFRCDVAGGVPLNFWEEAREAMDQVNRDVIMLAEADVPEQQLKAFDISYNFSYYSALMAVVNNGESAERIKEQWEKMRTTFPHGARFLHLNDNHDRNRADVVFGEKATAATSVLDFTLDGIPFLYNGEEIGDTTAPHQQSHVPIRWEIYHPTAQRHSGLAMRQAARIRFYKRLFEMRKQEPALTSGELTWVRNSNPDSVVSFVRQKGSDQILVLINLSNRMTKVELDIPTARYAQSVDLIKNQALSPPLTGDKFSRSLGAFDYVVAKRSSSNTP